MSDIMEDVSSKYEDDLFDLSSSNAGPFPIPEYPELVFDQGMWSTALDVILTTLRYLAPATLLTLFWGQQSFIFKLLKHVDSAFRAIVFSSEEEKREVLKWISESGSARIEHLDTIWRHGWIVCGVLDAALPGACAGHPPTRLSLKHAQAIADHYLGVEPVFSSQELESTASLSRHQEWKLATYLTRIRQALSKLTPPVSKPPSQRTSPETAQFTMDYVARGSGLTAAQIKNKMHFKIYPTAQQCLDPGDILVLIKGPKDTYGMTQISPILGKAQLMRQKILGLQVATSYTENILPITQGATYLRSFGKNKMSNMYFIPKVNYEIEIKYESNEDHVIVYYTVNIEGKYEISITSRGQHILGSPFQVTCSRNILSLLDKESFCLDDGEEIDIVDVQADRKVVLRIVDFVTEKMLLTEDGTLEKISEEEAKKLMNTDKETLRKYSHRFTDTDFCLINNSFGTEKNKFKNIAAKVKTLCKICRVFNSFSKASCIAKKLHVNYARPQSPQDIPDIVNSTFTDSNKNIFVKETRNKFVVAEPISVSIRNEVNDIKNQQSLTNISENIHLSETDAVLRKIMNDVAEHTATSNPFDEHVFEPKYTKETGIFVSSEYEADYSQNEEEPEAFIKIIVDEDNTTPTEKNLINKEIINLERPKTPVLKIITNNVKDREDSLYVDPKIAEIFNGDILSNEFINPFFMHQQLHTTQEAITPATDFLIGAPVTLPPILRATTPEPIMKSMLVGGGENSTNLPNTTSVDDDSPSAFSTPTHTCFNKNKDNLVSSTFHSTDSHLNENAELYEEEEIIFPVDKHASSKKELWDSAYVSIDDVANSPDSNNNDNISSRESPNKCRFSPCNINYTIKHEDLSKMGPAEREIWKTCNELKKSSHNQDEHSSKVQDVRLLFTPIIEESDRSLSVGVNTNPHRNEIDSVTVAFAEISDIYHKYYPQNSTTVEKQIKDYVNTRNRDGVDSASDVKTDVKRPTKLLEGTISEIQPFVTELLSASRTLRATESIEDEFGEAQANIVLEKKLYWDKRIKEIEAKTAESNAQQKRRKLSAKYIRNDSLTKRKENQTAETSEDKVNTNQNVQNTPRNTSKEPVVVKREHSNKNEYSEEISDVHLVEKWKKYWDNKLETKKDEEVTRSEVKSRSPKNINVSLTNETNLGKSAIDNNLHKSSVKQELPEEVFKAFETSPKRFFGTSRKQILNKIDNFLGKPSTEDPLPEDSNVNRETGLVSSRISLFHNISHTEELQWAKRKSQSMHNIFHRKNCDLVPLTSQKSQPLIRTPVNRIVKETNFVKEANIESGLCATVKEKRAKFVQNKNFSKTFDDNQHEPNHKYKAAFSNRFQPTKSILRKTSISKSEMDIFNKRINTVYNTSDCLDRHQSFDDLPKVNVKSFISLYETVSKASIESKPRQMSCGSIESHKNLHINNSESVKPMAIYSLPTSRDVSESPKTEDVLTPPSSVTPDGNDYKRDSDSGIQVQHTNTDDDRHSYISLSDMEIEIIEYSSPEKSLESSPERETETAHIEYKSRFKLAKQFFKSLEEITDETPPRKLNECEQLLYNETTNESPQRPPRRVKNNIKSNSMPSSEIAKAWNQLQDNKGNKLVKISEKFNVEDLFSDVVEGKLSRQGSLRGIPHKKAVLETFKSMDNLTDKNISAYEIVRSQLKDFTKENKLQNAQTYLSEYPYLPTTDPSKYHSRMDTKASGLITLKELLEKKYEEMQSKPRRNSVPDMRLTQNFTVEL